MTTEYVLWIDDDFEFTNGTDIELMVDILEDTDLDIVGGKAGSSGWGYTSIFNRIHGNSGDCLYRLYGHRGVVPNHPTCKYADLIQNFFLARTMAVRRIGFDGEFQRVAHKEFFADGLGELKVMPRSILSRGVNYWVMFRQLANSLTANIKAIIEQMLIAYKVSASLI